MAGAPIALAPEAAAGALSLFTLILWGIALGMALAWRNTIGAALEYLADVMDKVQVHAGPVRIRPLAPFSGGLRNVDWLIQNILDKTVTGCEHATVWLFHTMINMFEWTAHEIAALAEDSARVFWRVTTKTIPHAVKSAAHVQDQHLARERHKRSAAISRTNSHVSALRDDVHALGHATTIALPRDIGRVRGRTGRLERDFSGVKARLKSLEKILGAASFAGLVAVALDKWLGKWWRCPSLRNIGKRTGCKGFKFLEDLLFGVIDVLVIADLCRITGLMVDLAETGPVKGILHGFIDGFDKLVHCRKWGKAPKFAVRVVALPPEQARSALPPVETDLPLAA